MAGHCRKLGWAELPSSDEEGWRAERRGGVDNDGASEFFRSLFSPDVTGQSWLFPSPALEISLCKVQQIRFLDLVLLEGTELQENHFQPKRLLKVMPRDSRLPFERSSRKVGKVPSEKNQPEIVGTTFAI